MFSQSGDLKVDMDRRIRGHAIAAWLSMPVGWLMGVMYPRSDGIEITFLPQLSIIFVVPALAAALMAIGNSTWLWKSLKLATRIAGMSTILVFCVSALYLATFLAN
ncbi:MAG: hypothetical protein R3F12_08690 [Lysobacteraceae bacterium]